MPVHDWSRVVAGTFHDFHCDWVIQLKHALNGGVLPQGYYAMAEQHASGLTADVLTLKRENGEPRRQAGGGTGGTAVLQPPPRVSRTMVLQETAAYRLKRRTLTVRHVSDHTVVAMIEIVSPANKDRKASVDKFVQKTVTALECQCHLLVIDLLPPGPHDPQGMHGAIWTELGGGDYVVPEEKPLTMVAYTAKELVEAHVEPVAVGDALIPMPLFLDEDRYVSVPLETTYQAAFDATPEFWRRIIEEKS